MDKTREILLRKYRPAELLAQQQRKPQQQDVSIQKAAAVPPISSYPTIQEWLEVATTIVAGWPKELAKAVLKDMLNKHLSTEIALP